MADETTRARREVAARTTERAEGGKGMEGGAESTTGAGGGKKGRRGGGEGRGDRLCGKRGKGKGRGRGRQEEGRGVQRRVKLRKQVRDRRLDHGQGGLVNLQKSRIRHGERDRKQETRLQRQGVQARGEESELAKITSRGDTQAA
jgi:hypothetical protein